VTIIRDRYRVVAAMARPMEQPSRDDAAVAVLALDFDWLSFRGAAAQASFAQPA
jgi:hypothetical protein